MDTSLRVVVCTFRICRHYLLRVEAVLALFMLFTMWYYLKVCVCKSALIQFEVTCFNAFSGWTVG